MSNNTDTLSPPPLDINARVGCGEVLGNDVSSMVNVSSFSVGDIMKENDRTSKRIIRNDDISPNLLYLDEEENYFRDTRGPCSLRAFIIIMMTLLIVICSASIYVSVFVAMQNSVNDLSDNVLTLVQDKITLYIDSVLKNMEDTGYIMADHYNYNLAVTSVFRKYFFTPYKVSGLSVGYAFGNPSERYSYTIVGKQDSERIVYSYQPPGFIGSLRDAYDNNGTLLMSNETIDFTPYNVSIKDYYWYPLKESNRMGLEGAFSKPYIVTNGTLSISFGAKVYEQELLSKGIKQFKGIARIVRPLAGFSNFLSKNVKVFDNGYVIIKENGNDFVVAGSVNCSAPDEKQRLSIFGITDRSAGQLMQNARNKYGDLEKLPDSISITSLGVNYFINHQVYEYHNVKWDIYTVVVEYDIMKSTHISIAVSVSVAIFVTLFGVLFGIVLSLIVLKPITFLQEQFQKIKVLNLDGIDIPASLFDELGNVYTSLALTIRWLKEIRSFVPPSVIQDIRSASNTGRNPKKSQTVNHNPIYSKYEKTNEACHPFQTGLYQKECSLIHIRLNNYLRDNTPHFISNSFPKLMSVITDCTRLLHCDLHINSLEDFRVIVEPRVIKPNVVAIELALKLKKGLEYFNKQFKEEFDSTIDFSIGISTNVDSYVGNLGNKNHKVFSIISNSCKIAESLSYLASHNGVRIVADEQTLCDQFLCRPIDRFLVQCHVRASGPIEEHIQNVYEVIKEVDSQIEKEGW